MTGEDCPPWPQRGSRRKGTKNNDPGVCLLRPLEATVDADVLKRLGFPGRVMGMDTTPFDLTPEQKGMLAALSRETGKPISALIAKALEDLQEHEHTGHAPGEINGHEREAPAPQEASKPIWERIVETFSDLSEEDLERLPVDGAAQVDHYAYGLPKR